MCAGMYALETCLNFLLSHGCYINYISSMSHQSHVELNEAIFYRHINVYQMKSKCVSRENGKWYNRVLMMITVTMTTTRMMIMIKNLINHLICRRMLLSIISHTFFRSTLRKSFFFFFFERAASILRIATFFKYINK